MTADLATFALLPFIFLLAGFTVAQTKVLRKARSSEGPTKEALEAVGSAFQSVTTVISIGLVILVAGYLVVLYVLRGA